MRLSTYIGHRGIRYHAPENTAIGFEKASKYFSWVEFDATLTKDEQVVIFHDAEMSQLTKNTGTIGEKTLSELDHISVQDQPIPTLKDTIIQLETLGLHMNLEIKVNDERWEVLTDKTLEILKEIYTGKSKLLFSSFHHDVLCRVRKKLPNAVIGYLFADDLDCWQEKVLKVDAKTVHFSHKNITKEIVRQAKDMGLEIYVYTVNDRAKYNTLMSWGVDGIFTDQYPSFFE